MKNIILIGMPGVGKSTVGVILAKMIGYEFVDSDLVIQREEGMLLREIIAKKGLDGFIEVENRVNSELTPVRSVVATGGSVVYGSGAMEHFREIGTIVYLRQSFEELDRRLNNIRNRGVVFREGQSLKNLYDERCVLYEKYADVTVDEEGLDIEQTIEAVMSALGM